MASSIDDIFAVDNPILYILSDSRGETALAVVYAAAAQFPDGSVLFHQEVGFPGTGCRFRFLHLALRFRLRCFRLRRVCILRVLSARPRTAAVTAEVSCCCLQAFGTDPFR